MPLLDLADGYYDLPPGKLATVVTYLQMLAVPARPLGEITPPCALRRIAGDDLDGYRALFRKVGEDWLWTSRLLLSDADLAAMLGHPEVEPFALCQGEETLGLLELDFREGEACELRMFGLCGAAIGKGLGRALIDEGIRRVWARPIKRFWVHTCTFDSPQALPFYIRSGFTPYARAIEFITDPRLSGHLPRTAAPQIPIIE